MGPAIQKLILLRTNIAKKQIPNTITCVQPARVSLWQIDRASLSGKTVRIVLLD